jgi:polynucleotide 5'-hydroxyl-kinase GRC3/NOL9
MRAMIDIPPSWSHSVEQLLRHRWRKILVIGAGDRGKSTYCHVLCEHLLTAGHTVALVDADIGQKDIGPPAAITLGYPTLGQPLMQTSPAGWYFVGAVSPVRHLLPMVVGTQQLVAQAQAQRVVVNTTGLVHGVGRILKAFVIEVVRPDIIVAIARGRELSAVLAPYRHVRTFRLTPSDQARLKTREQRRMNRERAFARYFAAASEVTLPWRQVQLQRTLLFSGTRVPSGRGRYAERTAEGLLAIADTNTPHVSDVTVIPTGFECHLLCGVADGRGRGLGLAILSHIDWERETLTCVTPVPAGHLRLLQLGDMYVRPDGQEVEGRRPREG